MDFDRKCPECESDLAVYHRERYGRPLEDHYYCPKCEPMAPMDYGGSPRLMVIRLLTEIENLRGRVSNLESELRYLEEVRREAS